MDLYFTDFCVIVSLQKNNKTITPTEMMSAIGFTVHAVLLAKFQSTTDFSQFFKLYLGEPNKTKYRRIRK